MRALVCVCVCLCLHFVATWLFKDNHYKNIPHFARKKESYCTSSEWGLCMSGWKYCW